MTYAGPGYAIRMGPDKDAANREKHGLSFREASELFSTGADFLETERDEDVIRILSARIATTREQGQYLAYQRGRND